MTLVQRNSSMLAPSCRWVAVANGDHSQHTQLQLARLSVHALLWGGSQAPVPCLPQASPTPAVQLPAWLTRGEKCDLLTAPGSGSTSQGQVGHRAWAQHSLTPCPTNTPNKRHAAAPACGSPHRTTPRRPELQIFLCVPRTSHLISLGLSACLEPGEGQ